MDMPSAIKAVTERRDLSAEDMRAVMRLIMTGEATQSQIGGFLNWQPMLVSVARTWLIPAAPVAMAPVRSISPPPVPSLLPLPVPRWPSTATARSPVNLEAQTYWRQPV
jgi:hypothetical protein